MNYFFVAILNFNEGGIGWNLVMSLISVFAFMTFCLLKDHLVFEWLLYKFAKFSTIRSRALPIQNPNMDVDVREEIDKVKSMTHAQIKESNLVLKGITKYYGKLLAVNQLVRKIFIFF